MMRSRTIPALLVCAFLTWGASASAKQYSFGVVIEPMTSAETASERKQAYERFLGALSDRLKHPITLVVLPDTGEEARALEAGTVDMALLKTVAYGRAKGEDREITGLVTVVSRNDNEEEVTHSGYMVVLASSGVEDIGGLKGKRFGFVESSASGLVYPVAFLAGQGIDYKTYFSQHRCYENQHEMIKALKDGEIDAGTTFRAPHLKRNDDLRDLKVIARIPDIPNPVIAVSGSLSQEEKQSLKEALTQLPESAFQGLRFFGLKAIDEKLYEPVVELGKVNLCN